VIALNRPLDERRKRYRVAYIPVNAVPTWTQTGAALITQYGVQLSSKSQAQTAMNNLKSIQQKVMSSKKSAPQMMENSSKLII
jgi:hypothetical protein